MRAICGVYSQYPDALSRSLRERAQAGRGLFYTADGRIRPVQSPAEREEILRGDPCVIVSSSGMISGGPSKFYAAGLASSESSLISITGYQDEEAPGRRLQELAAASASAGSGRELMLGGRRVPIHCAVGTYTLSAHADAQELVGLVQSLAPRDLFLVHGDPQARQGLAGNLFDAGFRSVHLPAVGDEITLDAAPRRPGRRSAPMPAPGIGAARPFDSEALPELHRHLWATEPQRRTYSVADLAAHWYGSAAPGPDLQARPQHLPLGRALKDYAGARNRQKLLALLAPLSRAAEQSELIRELVDSGDIYHPLSWTPADAHRFLCEIALYEQAGLVVRIPSPELKNLSRKRVNAHTRRRGPRRRRPWPPPSTAKPASPKRSRDLRDLVISAIVRPLVFRSPVRYNEGMDPVEH